MNSLSKIAYSLTLTSTVIGLFVASPMTNRALGNEVMQTIIVGQSVDTASAANATDATKLGSPCKISCVAPIAADSDSEQVIETLKLLVQALNQGDLSTYEQYLAEGCTTFDEGSKHLIVGKQAVIDSIKDKMTRFRSDGDTPLLSYTIDHPYAKVTGDVAVVSFKGVREIGGKHPSKEVCKATDIFVKDGSKWKKLHYRVKWHKS